MMKICIAQTPSLKGAIQKSIQYHLQIIKKAIEANVDLVVFPELSITGYEPKLAANLASLKNEDLFESFQNIANNNNIAIAVGMPTRVDNGIHISMLIFKPNSSIEIYSKQLLHEDEFPYFIQGKQPVYLDIKGKRIAVGICYETLQESFIDKTLNSHVDIFIASVAKSERGIAMAHAYFPEVAKKFRIPVLMSNCIGKSDDFLSYGNSAIWNANGDCMGQLNDSDIGGLVFDTESELIHNFKL